MNKRAKKAETYKGEIHLLPKLGDEYLLSVSDGAYVLFNKKGIFCIGLVERFSEDSKLANEENCEIRGEVGIIDFTDDDDENEKLVEIMYCYADDWFVVPYWDYREYLLEAKNLYTWDEETDWPSFRKCMKAIALGVKYLEDMHLYSFKRLPS